jgi:hypothetical protein
MSFYSVFYCAQRTHLNLCFSPRLAPRGKMQSLRVVPAAPVAAAAAGKQNLQGCILEILCIVRNGAEFCKKARGFNADVR